MARQARLRDSTAAILVAAGQGTRLGGRTPKQFSTLGRRPMVRWSVDTLLAHPFIAKVVLVIPPRTPKLWKRGLTRLPGLSMVEGGKERQDSVEKGLDALGTWPGPVLVHDAARPFVDEDLVSDLIRHCLKSGAAVTAAHIAADTMVYDSPRGGDNRISGYLARDRVYAIETPQVFPGPVILEAFRRRGRRNLTDETSLLYALDFPVHLHSHSGHNPKITTRDDLAAARAYAQFLSNRSRD